MVSVTATHAGLVDIKPRDLTNMDHGSGRCFQDDLPKGYFVHIHFIHPLHKFNPLMKKKSLSCTLKLVFLIIFMLTCKNMWSYELLVLVRLVRLMYVQFVHVCHFKHLYIKLVNVHCILFQFIKHIVSEKQLLIIYV